MKIEKIIIENSWNNDQEYHQEVFLEEALEIIKETAYEDTDVDDYLTDNPTETIESYVKHILNYALTDWLNSYTYEYRGFTYQPVKTMYDKKI